MTGYLICQRLRGGPVWYAPYNGHECWTDDAARAFSFDDRADADHVRGALTLVAPGDYAVVPCSRRVEREVYPLDDLRFVGKPADLQHQLYGPTSDREIKTSLDGLADEVEREGL